MRATLYFSPTTNFSMKHFLSFVMLACFTAMLFAQERTLSGYVTDSETGDALVSATVFVKGTQKGAVTNSYGFYSITMPPGTYEVIFGYVGYKPDTVKVLLDKDVRLLAKLNTAYKTIEEVVISASLSKNQEEVNSPQMGKINLQIKDLRNLPALGGEVDIIKVIQLLPGVTRGGNGTTSMLVRGGDPDQNLILLDEATVYNVGHLFGFFSVFNSDAINDLDLIKGGFPAQYGGRASSVLAINTSEGNRSKFSGRGSVSMVASRLTLQGPIAKGRGAWSISGRRTYIDQMLRLVTLNLPYYFYDLNAKVNFDVNAKNKLYLSSYYGDDVLYTPKNLTSGNDSTLQLNGDFGFRLGNWTTTARWNHIYNPKFFANTSLIFTRFKYDINGSFGNNNIFIGSNVTDWGIKSDHTYYLSPDNTLKFGFQAINHDFRPNVISAQGDITALLKGKTSGKPLLAQELAVYASQNIRLSPRFRTEYGLRLSGAAVPDHFYAALEPRFSGVYSLGDKSSFKLGYSRMMQYMHLVSSSTVALPTDLWYPVTKSVKPQSAHQVAVSYTHNLDFIQSIFTIEAYYKWLDNLVEYKEGTNLILNNNFENQLLQGRGKANGLEFLLKRDEGRLRGWISYTLSYTSRQFDSLNNGKWYGSKYDRRHNLAVVGSYQFSNKFSLAFSYTYLSGALFTPQIGQYVVPNASYTGYELIPVYGARNSARLSASQRFDINIVLKSKPRKYWQGEWNLGAYNMFNSPSPNRVKIAYHPDRGYYYTQPGFLGFFPNVAYNFQF